MSKVEDLLGKTLKSVIRSKEHNADIIIFETTDNEKYKMYHEQDCCEGVSIHQIVGDLDDLINSPLTMAEVVTKEGKNDYGDERWTFYKFATIKGYVTIDWFGESNGYYSIDVDFHKLNENGN